MLLLYRYNIFIRVSNIYIHDKTCLMLSPPPSHFISQHSSSSAQGQISFQEGYFDDAELRFVKNRLAGRGREGGKGSRDRRKRGGREGGREEREGEKIEGGKEGGREGEREREEREREREREKRERVSRIPPHRLLFFFLGFLKQLIKTRTVHSTISFWENCTGR